MKYMNKKAIRSMVASLIFKNLDDILTYSYGIDHKYRDALHDDYRNRMLDNIIEPIVDILKWYRLAASVTKKLVAESEDSIYNILSLWLYDTNFCNKMAKLIMDTFLDGVEVGE